MGENYGFKHADNDLQRAASAEIPAFKPPTAENTKLPENVWECKRCRALNNSERLTCRACFQIQSKPVVS